MSNEIKARPIVVRPRITPLDLVFDKDQREEYVRQSMLHKLSKCNIPDVRNYYVIPVSKPHLKSCIKSFQWSCTNSEIILSIEETTNFGSYNWFSSLRKQEDSVVLVLMDVDFNEVTRISFHDLQLVDHYCGLNAVEGNETEVQPLCHQITLKYTSCEQAHVHETPVSQNPDDDWVDTKHEVLLASENNIVDKVEDNV